MRVRLPLTLGFLPSYSGPGNMRPGGDHRGSERLGIRDRPPPGT